MVHSHTFVSIIWFPLHALSLKNKRVLREHSSSAFICIMFCIIVQALFSRPLRTYRQRRSKNYLLYPQLQNFRSPFTDTYDLTRENVDRPSSWLSRWLSRRSEAFGIKRSNQAEQVIQTYPRQSHPRRRRVVRFQFTNLLIAAGLDG